MTTAHPGLQDGPIYLDYNATTPVDPIVVETMLPYLSTHFGNPSSTHRYGHVTRQAIDTARKQVAQLLGCTTGEIIFTGGGSESDNLAIRGVALALRGSGNHIISQVTVHPAVLYAPKGTGTLYVRRGVQLEPVIYGGGQESGRRAGTENIAHMVALGAACVVAREQLEENQSRLKWLRDRLEQRLAEFLPGSVNL